MKIYLFSIASGTLVGLIYAVAVCARVVFEFYTAEMSVANGDMFGFPFAGDERFGIVEDYSENHYGYAVSKPWSMVDFKEFFSFNDNEELIDRTSVFG